MVIPECYVYNNYGKHLFYHIIYPNENDKKCDCVFNFIDEDKQDKFKSVSGKLHLVLRIGGIEKVQLFIENNRNPNDNSKVEIKNSNGNSKGKIFMEQYFPIPDSFMFLRKSIKILEKIYYKHQNGYITPDYEFKKMIEEEFKEEVKDGDKQNKSI